MPYTWITGQSSCLERSSNGSTGPIVQKRSMLTCLQTWNSSRSLLINGYLITANAVHTKPWAAGSRPVKSPCVRAKIEEYTCPLK